MSIEHLAVGTRVRINAGHHTGEETVITRLIPDYEGKDEDMRYDVACAKGRFYYREEITMLDDSQVVAINGVLNRAFALCAKYKQRYGVYPVRIGVSEQYAYMSDYAVSPAQDTPDIPFFVHQSVKEHKMWLFNSDGKAITSLYLEHSVPVPLEMLPQALQEHYRPFQERYRAMQAELHKQ